MGTLAVALVGYTESNVFVFTVATTDTTDTSETFATSPLSTKNSVTLQQSPLKLEGKFRNKSVSRDVVLYTTVVFLCRNFL